MSVIFTLSQRLVIYLIWPLQVEHQMINIVQLKEIAFAPFELILEFLL